MVRHDFGILGVRNKELSPSARAKCLSRYPNCRQILTFAQWGGRITQHSLSITAQPWTVLWHLRESEKWQFYILYGGDLKVAAWGGKFWDKDEAPVTGEPAELIQFPCLGFGINNVDSSPPLLCLESLGHISAFEKCWPRDVRGIFVISWVINSDQPFQSGTVKNAPCDQQKKLKKKSLPWKYLGCLSLWLKFSPFSDLTHTHTCAPWLKHPSSPRAGLQTKSWAFILGFPPHFYIFFPLFLTERTLGY